jgi:hypothetical protein
MLVRKKKQPESSRKSLRPTKSSVTQQVKKTLTCTAPAPRKAIRGQASESSVAAAMAVAVAAALDFQAEPSASIRAEWAMVGIPLVVGVGTLLCRDH